MDAANLARLLAADARRRVLAALLLGAETVVDVTSASRLDTREAVTALTRLVGAGLVTRSADGRYAVSLEEFDHAAASSRTSKPAPAADAATDEERILRTFVQDGVLLSIPAQRSKRLVILDHLAAAFEPGVHYPEHEVNAVLRRSHPDTAALRRYLVDEGFLDRDQGEYWRSGGTVTTGTAE